ncbi:MAG: hypothetical protein HY754_05495 [Nitrospirae bacterium]|nr:hypothetical protein [Nitrospirota bacterium]
MKRINKQQRVKISILISVLLLISAIFFIQGCTSLSGSNNSTDNNSAPPSAPTGLSVTSANQKITISWNTRR